MPSSSSSATRSARPPWLAIEGLTACSSTATTRRASGPVMPLASTSGGTPGAASSGRRRVRVDQHEAATALLGPLEPGAAQAVDAGGRHDDLELVLGVPGIALVGVGGRLEVEVVDEDARLHAAHLEPQGQAAPGRAPASMASCTILCASGVRVTTGSWSGDPRWSWPWRPVYGVPVGRRTACASGLAGRPKSTAHAPGVAAHAL